MSQLQGTADSYPQLGSGPILTCPCQDIPAGPGKRLPGYGMPGRAHQESACHLDPSPGLTPAPAPAPQRWRNGGAAPPDPLGSIPPAPSLPLHPSRSIPPAPSLLLHLSRSIPPAPSRPGPPLSPPRPLVPVPGRSRRRRLTCPGAGNCGSCRSRGTCRSCGAMGTALRDAAPRGGRAQGPGPPRPGPAHTRQKNAAGPGPRGRGGRTALYRRKQRPTRASRPAGGCAAPGGTGDCEPMGIFAG